MESLVLAAHQKGQLLTDTDAILERLRQLTWDGQRVDLVSGGNLLFQKSGERQPATGEHVVWLRPETKEGPKMKDWPQTKVEPPLITTWYQVNCNAG